MPAESDPLPPYTLTSLDCHAAFHQLAPAMQVLPAGPAFHFGTWPAALATFFYGRDQVPAAGIYETGDIAVGGGLLLVADGMMVEAAPLNWQVAYLEAALRRHGAPDPAVHAEVLPGTCALIVTPGYPIFGHWLADMLPRLGLLEAAGHDLDALTYLVPADVPPFGLELLRLAGIGQERLRAVDSAHPVRPARLLLPTFPHNGRQFMAPMAQSAALLRRRAEALLGPLDAGGTPPCILLSRHGWDGRRMVGREAFEAAAMRHGFQVVSPETMPMEAQLRLFGGAREIIGEYGSALHGSLYAPAGTVVCALRGTQPHPAFIQSGLGDAIGQLTGYVFGQSSDDPEQRGFSIDMADVTACLDTVFPPTRPRRGAAAHTVAAEPAVPLPARPAHPDPTALLASLEAALGEGAPEEAERIGQRLQALAPRHPGLGPALIAIQLALGHRQEAVRLAVAAVDRDPASSAARDALAALLPSGRARPAEYGLGDTVAFDFTEAGCARPHMGVGWSGQGVRQTWMVDESSAFTLPALSPALDWLGMLDTTPITPGARLHILYDGHLLARLQVARQGRVAFRIPREVVAAGDRGLLVFEHPDCATPLALGRGRDTRRLAFAARSLVLTPDAAPG